MKRKRYVVYSLPQHWTRPMSEVQADIQWANADNVRALFQNEHQRQKRFFQFLNEGSLGVFFVSKSQWMSYAWMTAPSSQGPTHMRVAASDNLYWIFHCRTLEPFRGQGLYKQSLQALANRARHEHPESCVHIDTEVDNVPSRSAIVSVGFQPHGTATVWTLRIPKMKWWTRSVWYPARPHPAMLDNRKRLTKTLPKDQYSTVTARRIAQCETGNRLHSRESA